MYLIKWVFEESSNCFGNKKADLIKSQNRCRFQINKKGFASSLECKRIINILAKIRIRQAMQVVVAVVNAASSSSFFLLKTSQLWDRDWIASSEAAKVKTRQYILRSKYVHRSSNLMWLFKYILLLTVYDSKLLQFYRINDAQRPELENKTKLLRLFHKNVLASQENSVKFLGFYTDNFFMKKRI